MQTSTKSAIKSLGLSKSPSDFNPNPHVFLSTLHVLWLFYAKIKRLTIVQ